MFNPLSLFIGIRYTQGAQGRLVSFIAITSIAGITLGVAVMIIVLSVMNGFEREMRFRVLQLIPHITVESVLPKTNWQEVATNIASNEQTVAISGFVRIPGLISNKQRIKKTLLEGVDTNFNQVSIIQNHLTFGDFSDLTDGSFNLIVGSKLAEELNVNIGDKITFITPEVIPTPAGIFPRLKRFTISGIFHVGVGEIDGFSAYANINDLAKLKRMPPNQIEGLRIKVHDLFSAPLSAKQIISKLGPGFYATDWTVSYGDLYRAIGIEKSMVSMLLLLIIAVATFNLVSCLMIGVNDKRSAIAILRTQGATSGTIIRIFVVQGMLIGIIGILLGIILGLIIASNISYLVSTIEQLFGFKILDANVYFIDYLPAQIMLTDIIKIGCATFLLSLIATIYPSFKAAKTNPAEVLRYE